MVGEGVPGVPVQVTPFRENVAGAGFEPVQEALKPKVMLLPPPRATE
jgi:hypothetical protein